MGNAAKDWNKILVVLCLYYSGGEKLLEIKTRVLHCFTIVYIEIHFHVYQIIKCTCFSVKFVMIF